MAATIPMIDKTHTERGESAQKGSLGPIPEVGSPPTSRLEGLSRLLRGVGALALLAAASSFLLQHWESGGDVWRYYALLAHTGLLGGLGFFWGLRAGDAKGARTFLALASGLVPAHFCILGGLVYSQFSWDGPLTQVASYASWVAPDATSALLAVGLTLAALGVVTAVAFVALARVRATLFGAAYVAGNAMLLLPTRDPSIVAALAGVQIAALVALELRVVRGEPRLRTLEGGFVRAMLWAPVLLMLARSVLHYDLSSLFCAVASGAIAIFSTALASERRVPELARAALRGVALAAVGCASGFATFALAEGVGLPESALLPIGGLGFASTATALSLSAGSAAWGVAYRRVAAWVLLAAMALDLWIFPGVVAAFACLVTAIAAMSYGFLTRRRPIFLAGVAGGGLALITHLRAAIDFYAFANWGSLALLGVAVILIAAGVERRGAIWAAQFSAWRARFADWE
jgi:hypothetical protein